MFENHSLSPAGQQRREAILRQAKAEVRSRRQRRRTLQGMGGVIMLGLAMLIIRHGHEPARHPIAVTPHLVVIPPAPVILRSMPGVRTPQPQRVKAREIVITRIATELNLSHRLAVKATTPRWRKLNDDELIQQLADAGRPAGLAWIDGREMILFRDPPHRRPVFKN